MIKRVICFSNPAYLSVRNYQLVIKLPEVEKANVPISFKNKAIKTIPIEDIGVIILDHKQITITQALLEILLKNNCSIISCDCSHLPTGLFLPLSGNTTQTERFRKQTEAKLPLKKQLWQQTIISKIENQAKVLISIGVVNTKNMLSWAAKVKSGDSDNKEARAATYYWKNIFKSFIPSFIRDREGDYPNNLLNYGYAILRAIVARALVSSGLLPSFGIFHRNRYNAYCLADDIMEPYRPFIDKYILELCVELDYQPSEITNDIKIKLLKIPILDVYINGKNCVLTNAISITTSSLQKCYTGESKKIIYPIFI